MHFASDNVDVYINDTFSPDVFQPIFSLSSAISFPPRQISNFAQENTDYDLVFYTLRFGILFEPFDHGLMEASVMALPDSNDGFAFGVTDIKRVYLKPGAGNLQI
jgi:hypothetical protein